MLHQSVRRAGSAIVVVAVLVCCCGAKPRILTNSETPQLAIDDRVIDSWASQAFLERTCDAEFRLTMIKGCWDDLTKAERGVILWAIWNEAQIEARENAGPKGVVDERPMPAEFQAIADCDHEAMMWCNKYRCAETEENTDKREKALNARETRLREARKHLQSLRSR